MTQFKLNYTEPNSVSLAQAWFEIKRAAYQKDQDLAQYILHNISKVRYTHSWAEAFAEKIRDEGMEVEILNDSEGYWIALNGPVHPEKPFFEGLTEPIVASLVSQGYSLKYGTNGYVVYENGEGDRKIFGSYEENIEENLDS